ncbi:hypothetical protein ACM39_12655 [Chryseobacterium sp. FH2]|uniref:class I lanthipeptide n=1 Tax=Chryseobacterium sp. FH2 TaxID=1674291 RepID=UPI00065A969A|nr:class I lanthipeptide [Chryseobacterium sp. FH2]KMQ67698.1 hypothetical protein ACM39_12655 [Chryseobacterium sp. FH2]
MTKKKLSLNKEKITKLTKEQSAGIQGAGSQNSSNHDFTCCLCTAGQSKTKVCMEPWEGLD